MSVSSDEFLEVKWKPFLIEWNSIMPDDSSAIARQTENLMDLGTETGLCCDTDFASVKFQIFP
jgi:hypothetical protein